MNKWHQTTSVGRVGKLGLWMLALGPLAAACGGERPDGAMPSEDAAQAAPAEPVGTSTEALDTDGDRPIVTSSPAYLNTVAASYVLAVDTSGNLQEMSYTTTFSVPNNYVPTFGTWTRLDTGLSGVPTLHVYPDTTAVDEYARGADGNLYEYFRSGNDGDITKFNVSDISGFGKIAGSPVVVDWGDDSSEWAISVAVRRASDDALYTLDYTNGMGWQAHPVWNGSAALKTQNTILSQNVWLENGDDHYFAGRGVSSTDTSTSWIAKRPNGSFGGSFSVYSTFTGSGSTPWIVQGAPSVVYARFGTQLKRANVVQGSLTWSVLQNCSVAGSPTYAGIRGTNDHLLTYDFNACHDQGEILTSAPSIYALNDHLQFFRGSSGAIHAHQVGGANQGYSLHLSVP